MKVRSKLILAFTAIVLMNSSCFAFSIYLGTLAGSSEGNALLHGYGIHFLFQAQLVLLLTSLVISVGLLLLLANILSRPIQNLQLAIDNLREFQFDFQAETTTNDEIGKLTRSFNSIIGDLQLSRSEKSFFDTAIEATPEPLLLLNNSGKILTANKQARAVLSLPETYSSEYFIESCQELELREAWDRFLSSEAQSFRWQTKISGDSAGPRDVVVFAQRFTSPINQQRTIAISLQDISEILSITSERDSYHHALKDAEHLASLGTIVAIVAHKLRQPLTAIQLFLEQGMRALRDAEKSPHDELVQTDKIERKLKLSLAEVQTANTIVEELLLFSRRPSNSSKVNISNTIQKVSETLKERMKENLLSIEHDVDPKLSVMMPDGELDSICFFLIQNAIEACDKAVAASLKIVAVDCGEQITLSFSDTCGGIASEDLEKIFDLFFTTKGAKHGTGLGLPIIKKTMTQIGGSVQVSSNLGSGTTFELSFPSIIAN